MTMVGLAPRTDRDDPGDLPDGGGRWLLILAALTAVLVVVLLGGVLGLAGGGDRAEVRLDPPAAAAAPARTTDVYRGLGAWVDVFDFAPAYQEGDADPLITPAEVDVMVAHGVDTVYLQAARDDSERSDGLVDPETLGEFLVEAHASGLRAVAWYTPTFADVDTDLDRLRALHEFSHQGEHFDGVAVDLEWTGAVGDDDERSSRLVELSERLREAVGDDALGAVVLPPVLLEDVNPEFWSGFPWREIADVYDVWLPMSYWTFRSGTYEDPRRYTVENVELLRERLGRPDALVHVLGGVSTEATVGDYERFAEAIVDTRPVGASVFDFPSISTAEWRTLRRELTADVWGTDGLRE